MPDSQKHLLLVEDESALRQAIAEQLTDRGFHVQQVDSGEAAMAQLADFAFDIIITDLRLPGMDGTALPGGFTWTSFSAANKDQCPTAVASDHSGQGACGQVIWLSLPADDVVRCCCVQ